MSKQRGQAATVRATRWQQDLEEQVALDWSSCMDCGTADVLPRNAPPRPYERPQCAACLRVRAEAASRMLFPD